MNEDVIALLGPLVALVAWSLVMMLWLYSARFAALKQAGISIKGRVGSHSGSLDGVLPAEAQWKAHNYNHLMEQPTLFYAIVLALALMDAATPINLALAWAYVGLRIAHSLVQATTNIVRTRFGLFSAASLCLFGLTIHAAALVIRAML